MDADFLIQAGHEGLYRNSGTGRTKSVGTSGLPSPGDEEYKLTPVVADEAARLLRAVGYKVIREDAFYDRKYSVRTAVSLHFDGAATPCRSGTSVGYPDGVPVGSNKPTAQLWKAAYLPYFPFKKMGDNFTVGLRGYYGYKYTSTEVAEFLIEFGELTCPEQNEWLQARIKDGYLAKMVAHVLDKSIGGTKIPHPGDWQQAPPVEYDDSELRGLIAALTAQVKTLESRMAVTLAESDKATKVANLALKRVVLAHTRLDKLHSV